MRPLLCVLALLVTLTMPALAGNAPVLRVVSTPGAAVTVDRVRAGTVGGQGALVLSPPGWKAGERHVVEISKSGFVPRARTVVLRAGVLEIKLPLKPGKGISVPSM